LDFCNVRSLEPALLLDQRVEEVPDRTAVRRDLALISIFPLTIKDFDRFGLALGLRVKEISPF
jgi:hypothetical protein